MSYSLSLQRLLCCIVVLCLFHSDHAGAQPDDPFRNQDPFAKRDGNSIAGERSPISIDIHVTDVNGLPVPEARVRGPGITRPLHTNQDGAAELRTDEGLLRNWARRSNGNLRYHVQPAARSLMPALSKLARAEDLLKRKTLDFQTQPGVELSGRVIGKKDQQPIEGATVVIRSADASNKASPRHAMTDDEGRWNFIAPRADVILSVRGNQRGYKLDDTIASEKTYSRKINISDTASQLSGLDFEIQQIDPTQILVTDQGGRPVPNAEVSVYRQHWMDDRTVVWDSLSPSQTSDAAGACTIYLDESQADKFLVSASANLDGSPIQGRVVIASDDQDPIRIVTRIPSKIGGIVLENGQSVSNKKVVLYEITENRLGQWVTIGVHDEAITNPRGQYVFNAIPGVRYLVATKQRNKQGVQRILLQMSQPAGTGNQRLDDIDLADL